MPDYSATATSAAPVSGVNVQEYMGNQVNNPSLPPGAVMSGAMISAANNEFQGYSQLGTQSGISATTASTAQGTASRGTAALAGAPAGGLANTYNASLVGPNAATTAGVERGGLSQKAQMDAQLGGLSLDTLVALDPRSVEGQVDPRSLVQNQYKAILADTGSDGIPLFARDAVRKAEATMAARGLGASSMAGEAITSAVLQAAMPIAAQDAKVFETMTLQNLDKKAQATFLKAGYLAQMDMKNLDNRQQAAVFNAQGFLGLDMKNLDNSQQATLLSTQNRQQGLLSDQAASNAAKQFNAASQTDVDKYFAGLTADINKFNAAQQSAMSQFNAGQETTMSQFNTGQANTMNQYNSTQQNAVDQFNSTLSNQREQFNATNRATIDASNTAWRRNINTANTTTENAVNQINATNILNQSEFALQALWQETRDNASWAFQASENDATRQSQIALAAMNREAIFAQQSEADKAAWGQALGRFAANIFSRPR